MTLNQLVENLCGSKHIIWLGEEAIFSEYALADLFEHLMDTIIEDHGDAHGIVKDWEAARDTVELLAMKTDAFEAWDNVDGVMRDEY